MYTISWSNVCSNWFLDRPELITVTTASLSQPIANLTPLIFCFHILIATSTASISKCAMWTFSNHPKYPCWILHMKVLILTEASSSFKTAEIISMEITTVKLVSQKLLMKKQFEQKRHSHIKLSFSSILWKISFKDYLKYQGVEEFHMLACISFIVKLYFSVLSNLKLHIIIHPRSTNDYALSILWKPLKCTVKVNYTKCAY